MTTSILSLPKALQERLATIMAARPSHICGAHWLQRVEGVARVEVLSCKCKPEPVEHHRGEHWHPAPAQLPIPGVDDERAVAALKARERQP